MRFAAGALATLLFAGCATTQQAALPASVGEAAARGFASELVAAGPLLVPAWHRLRDVDGPVRVYIEGDGRAWQTRTRPSDDPTPRNPVALKLALRDRSANVIYLGRPCQYAARINDRACAARFWTTDRFAPEVIVSTAAALDRLTGARTPRSIELIGYSGGAAVALLVAARAPERFRVTTVAGVLDHAAWTRHHGDAPLSGSLNPADFVAQLRTVPQRHFVGRMDDVVPAAIAESYRQRLGQTACMTAVAVAEATHEDGWETIFAGDWDARRCEPACGTCG